MNIKFKRTVAVDFENVRLGEIEEKTFRKGQTVEAVVEKLSNHFSNLHFFNSDLAMSVPNDSFEVVV